MHPAIHDHLSEISDLCRRYRVKRLVLFGSAARGSYDPAASDIDLIVDFIDPGSPGYADRYLNLALALEKVTNRPVDLLTERSIQNPIFRHSIHRDQIELYAA